MCAWGEVAVGSGAAKREAARTFMHASPTRFASSSAWKGVKWLRQ